MADNSLQSYQSNADAAMQMRWQELTHNFIFNVESLALLAEDVENRRITPMLALDKLNLPIQYTNIREAGSSRCPTYGITLIVATVTFDGWGCTKVEAIMAATMKCFYRILFILETTTVRRLLPIHLTPETIYSPISASILESIFNPPPTPYGCFSGWPFENRFLLDKTQGIWKGRKEVSTTLVVDNYDQKLAEDIAKLVTEKFHVLTKNAPELGKSKVFAGIVITINNNIEDARVIAVATGNRYIPKKKINDNGRSINDFRAEVMARRCLQRHLYAQLYMYSNQTDPRITIADNDLEPGTLGYQLKSDRQVHMYISNARCRDCLCSGTNEQFQRGQRQAMICNGASNYRENQNSLAKISKGDNQNKRLLYSTSCSDKLMKWCVVGLQGSLLSRLILPVYLHSLVLGSTQEHNCDVSRATCNPLEAYLSALPMPFKLHCPLLAYVTTCNVWTKRTAPQIFSLLWCCTATEPEIMNSRNGNLKCGLPSLLCKQIVYGKWLYLIKRLPLTRQIIESAFEPIFPTEDLREVFYVEAKKLCPAYLVTKTRLVDALKEANLNQWVRKPKKQDRFVSRYYPACDPKSLFK